MVLFVTEGLKHQHLLITVGIGACIQLANSTLAQQETIKQINDIEVSRLHKQLNLSALIKLPHMQLRVWGSYRPHVFNKGKLIYTTL